MMNELCRLATIILVVVTTNDLDFVFICILQQWSSNQTRERLIDNHQPIGAAQIKCVSVLDCDRRAHGSRRSHDSEE